MEVNGFFVPPTLTVTMECDMVLYRISCSAWSNGGIWYNLAETEHSIVFVYALQGHLSGWHRHGVQDKS